MKRKLNVSITATRREATLANKAWDAHPIEVAECAACHHPHLSHFFSDNHISCVRCQRQAGGREVCQHGTDLAVEYYPKH